MSPFLGMSLPAGHGTTPGEKGELWDGVSSTAKTGGFHPLPHPRGNGFLGLLFFFPFASPGKNSDELSEAGKLFAALVSSLYPRADQADSAHGTHLVPQHLPGSLTLHQVTWWQ